MRSPSTGTIIAVGIALAIALILLLNLQGRSPDPATPAGSPEKSAPVVDAGSSPASPPAALATAEPPAAPFQEYEIGKTSRHQMNIASVWLPPVQMDHGLSPSPDHATGHPQAMPLPEDPDVIHLEADVRAEPGNLNGFAVGEWIPYLSVDYEMVFQGDASGEPRLAGKLTPMVAKDGPHYGATIRMPRRGKYRLTYRFQPPSANGFGRHTDPVTGVDPWWQPFSVDFDFSFEGVPQKKP